MLPGWQFFCGTLDGLARCRTLVMRGGQDSDFARNDLQHPDIVEVYKVSSGIDATFGRYRNCTISDSFPSLILEQTDKTAEYTIIWTITRSMRTYNTPLKPIS